MVIHDLRRGSLYADDRRVGLVAVQPLTAAGTLTVNMFRPFRKRRDAELPAETPQEVMSVGDLLEADVGDDEVAVPAVDEDEPAGAAVTHVLAHIDDLWSVPVHVVDDHGDVSAVACEAARGFPALRAGMTLTLRECSHSSGRLRDLARNGWALTQAHPDPQFSFVLDEAPGYRSAGRAVTLPYLMCVLRTAEVAKAAHARWTVPAPDVSRPRFDVHA
jgi:hypothetical protein